MLKMDSDEAEMDCARDSPIRMSSSVQPVGAENTAIGPNESDFLSSLIRFRILGIPLPSTSRRLPPNFATEILFLTAIPPLILSLAR